ncbi:MAG: peptide chain release factor N(5)-glutamine methyltransferase, partial [Ruminococcus sp.]|nr:peptide chain release factor N(5)-glutamine methyltransferase [Ruminococcus sp.]
EREICEKDFETHLLMCQRRAKVEPLQYITGCWEFYGRKYYVGEGVLIPRDDTEVVLRSTFPFLDKLKEKKDVKILDLCSGSGILAITLKLLYPKAQVTAVEISDSAVEYLRRNSKENCADIRIIHDDIFACVDSFEDGEFDMIISNPPYVTPEDMENLQKEVTFEPSLALAGGGEDGCDFYRRIIPLYTPKLRNGGMLAFEYDAQQAFIIKDLMEQKNYSQISIFDDLGGVHRAINGTMHKI